MMMNDGKDGFDDTLLKLNLSSHIDMHTHAGSTSHNPVTLTLDFLSYKRVYPRAVLAPAVWGVRALRRWAGHLKNFVGYMYKYAVFDIKLAYNHYFIIPFVQIIIIMLVCLSQNGVLL